MRPNRHRPARRLLAAAATLVLLLTGCGGEPEAAGSGDSEVSGALTVFAAASLTGSFEALGKDFTAAHPDVDVQFNFAGSQALAAQITQGAPADVFASANQRQMDKVVDAELATGEPQVFAGNALQIVVPAGNPDGITGLADLAGPELKVVLAAEDVPVGGYSREALDAAGVRVEPVSLENDVKAVATKVALGEADAGIVYATDVTAEGDGVEGVDIPDEHNVPATYPIATVREAANPDAARAFVDFVRSDAGQSTLEEFGFLPWTAT